MLVILQSQLDSCQGMGLIGPFAFMAGAAYLTARRDVQCILSKTFMSRSKTCRILRDFNAIKLIMMTESALGLSKYDLHCRLSDAKTVAHQSSSWAQIRPLCTHARPV
jgi:hypothetical protein